MCLADQLFIDYSFGDFSEFEKGKILRCLIINRIFRCGVVVGPYIGQASGG